MITLFIQHWKIISDEHFVHITLEENWRFVAIHSVRKESEMINLYIYHWKRIGNDCFMHGA